MKRTVSIVILLVLVLVLWLLSPFLIGLPMMHGSKYSEVNLRGLTRDQVLERLGEPYYDPALERLPRGTQRVPTTRPWDEAAEGPYSLAYARGFATCVIEFKDGRVATVRRFYK